MSPTLRSWEVQDQAASLADSGEGCHLVADSCLLVFPRGGEEKELLGAFFLRASISLMEAPSSCSEHRPEVLPPNTITLGIKFCHMNLRGHKYSVCSRYSMCVS